MAPKEFSIHQHLFYLSFTKTSRHRLCRIVKCNYLRVCATCICKNLSTKKIFKSLDFYFHINLMFCKSKVTRYILQTDKRYTGDRFFFSVAVINCNQEDLDVIQQCKCYFRHTISKHILFIYLLMFKFNARLQHYFSYLKTGKLPKFCSQEIPSSVKYCQLFHIKSHDRKRDFKHILSHDYVVYQSLYLDR